LRSRLIVLLVFTACTGDSERGPPPAPEPPITCSWTLSWTNPTEDVDDKPLDPTELLTATLYTASIPLAPTEQTMQVPNIPPYVLAWELRDITVGTYYYRLTVSNDAGESDKSNETIKECG